MSDLHVKYLLVGGGAAAFAAANAIRTLDPHGPLMLVGREINRPYHRTPLSKGFLRRQESRASLFTCEPDWYIQHSIQLRTGCRVAHLDTGRSIATLDSGESITYDRMLLATGSMPRTLGIPGDHLPNIYYLRTIEEAERLQGAIEKARHEGRRHIPPASGRGHAVVIGAGLMGVEIAACIAQAGIAVDLICGGAHPWSRFAGEGTGKFLSHYLTRCGFASGSGGAAPTAGGLAVHEGTRAARVEGDGRAQRIVLSDGQKLDCDFLVAAVGVMPNKDLLRGTGIVAEAAILADQHCRTNVPNIYAAGDCAAVYDPIFQKHRPAEQWDTAAATGEIAGRNMAGQTVKISRITTFATELCGIKARAWGSSKHLSRRIMRGMPSVEAPQFVEIGLSEDGRVSQVLAVGTKSLDLRAPPVPGNGSTLDDATIFEELIRRRARIDGNEEAVKDPAWPLANLLS